MSRVRGYGPTLAGSGRCTSYIDAPVCEADVQCLWKPKAKKCALKPAHKVIDIQVIEKTTRRRNLTQEDIFITQVL